ncbi:MAG: putative secondary metabolism biosynthetic enzyme [Alyxoria varia]|nr:MAG: putative secondary metabolism biosynthetic enzyme [Alyxoria varia]
MASRQKFQGWLGKDENAVGNMSYEEFQPKKWSEDDVDIQISHCGMCGSDIHTLRSGWGGTDYPCCVGHEIVGKAVRVGSNAGRGIKEGDVVGVGAQSDACMQCEECKAGEENHCSQMTNTFDDKFPDGSKSMGGYANYARVPGRFCFKIPAGLPLSYASPLLCGGVTIWTPLVENGCGPGKTIGIVGTGGIGHFGVIFAKALGAKRVIAFSRKPEKREDALKMGADEYVATDEDKEWEQKYARSLDLIVCTISSPNIPIQGYLKTLRVRGQFIQVGAPEDVIPGFDAFDLIPKAAKIGGSIIGSRTQIEEMLRFCAERKLKFWVEERPMAEANQVTKDFEAGKPRYRYVLVN